MASLNEEGGKGEKWGDGYKTYLASDFKTYIIWWSGRQKGEMVWQTLTKNEEKAEEAV